MTEIGKAILSDYQRKKRFFPLFFPLCIKWYCSLDAATAYSPNQMEPWNTKMQHAFLSVFSKEAIKLKIHSDFS